MQILFIIIGLIGLVLVVFSIKILFKQFKKKNIIEFALDSKTNSFDLKTTGQYSICLIGAKLMTDNGKFQAELKTEKGKEIKLNKLDLKYRFRHNRQFGLEYWSFNITEIGKYNLIFNGLTDLVAKNSMLVTTSILQKEVDLKSLKVLIKEVVPAQYRIMAIISFVIGINAFCWGTIITLFPNLFE